MQAPADYMLNENETNNLGLGKQVSWSPDQNAAVAAYSPEGNGVVAQNQAFPMVSAYNDEAALPASSTPTVGQVPPTVSLNTPQASPQQPSDRWGASSPLWSSLMGAGFGMMASRSPFPGVAIGEGGLQGLQTYQNLQKQQINVDIGGEEARPAG